MTSTNIQAQNSGDTKAAVLNAAQRLITQYGYEGFSMRDLAQHCGLAKATLYHHFADKHEIILQVLQRDLTTIRDILAEAAQTPGDVRSRLRNVIIAYFKIVTEQGTVLLSTLRQAAQTENEFIKLISAYRDEIHNPIIKILLDAKDEGVIRETNLDMAATSFFGILQVFSSNYLLLNSTALDDDTADFIVDFTLYGLQSIPDQESKSRSCTQILKNLSFPRRTS